MMVSTARRLSGLAVLICLIGMSWASSAGAASAHSSTTVRLGLTGMVTPSAPAGTWRISAHAGQTLGFLAGLIPGIDHLDIAKDINVRVSMNAADLPGGAPSKTLSTHNPYRLTLRKAGSYPVHWTIAFVLDRGHRSTVEASRDFNATIVVGGSSGGNTPDLVNPGVDPSRTSGQPSAAPATTANRITTPHQSAGVTGVPVPTATPTITLPPDTGASRHAQPGTLAALPLSTPADTYLFTALVGTFVIGMLWLLWIASIRPILGR